MSLGECYPITAAHALQLVEAARAGQQPRVATARRSAASAQDKQSTLSFEGQSASDRIGGAGGKSTRALRARESAAGALLGRCSLGQDHDVGGLLCGRHLDVLRDEVKHLCESARWVRNRESRWRLWFNLPTRSHLARPRFPAPTSRSSRSSPPQPAAGRPPRSPAAGPPGRSCCLHGWGGVVRRVRRMRGCSGATWPCWNLQGLLPRTSQSSRTGSSHAPLPPFPSSPTSKKSVSGPSCWRTSASQCRARLKLSVAVTSNTMITANAFLQARRQQGAGARGRAQRGAPVVHRREAGVALLASGVPARSRQAGQRRVGRTGRARALAPDFELHVALWRRVRDVRGADGGLLVGLERALGLLQHDGALAGAALAQQRHLNGGRAAHVGGHRWAQGGQLVDGALDAQNGCPCALLRGVAVDRPRALSGALPHPPPSCCNEGLSSRRGLRGGAAGAVGPSPVVRRAINWLSQSASACRATAACRRCTGARRKGVR